MSDAFEEGQNVQLKSGGPVMVINNLKPRGHFNEIECKWFIGPKLHTGYFKKAALKIAIESDNKSD